MERIALISFQYFLFKQQMGAARISLIKRQHWPQIVGVVPL